ncbi:hypothetical protein ACFSUK_28665 [Sphingobium scionense]|uniref:Uncharacterized protein n=1 Tax=Sphingobium scionense TaxID=1404341 RepID=A0A7W6LRH3_9SPHN|nr:hypothetical protein [Sphingobium scionense]MBB4148012.1 hypothetical protein [Sphingobium scionense]
MIADKTNHAQPVGNINITAEMIKAGAMEMRRFQIGEPLERVAEAVYLAMVIEANAHTTGSGGGWPLNI